MRRIVLIIFICFSYLFSFAQDALDFQTVDKNTYDLYTQKKWNDLITTGENAIKQNIDYFYLRMRIGIAYYEKQNYRKAGTHFEKAAGFNSSDELVQEYLYFSYLFSGRESDARLFSYSLSTELKTKLKISDSLHVKAIYFEGGNNFSNNYSKNNSTNLLGTTGKEGKQDLYDNFYYFQFGLMHYAGKRTTVYHGFTDLSTSIFQKVSSINPLNNKTNNYSLTQYEYYLNANILLTRGLKLIPAAHLIYVSFPVQKPLPLNQPNKPALPSKDTTFFNYAASIALEKDISMFNFGVNVAIGGLNNGKQLQTGLNATIFPTGNKNLYIGTVFTYWNETVKSTNTNSFVASALIGVKARKKLWIEASGAYGDMRNFTEKNAFVIYNSPDVIKQKYGLGLIAPFTKNLDLSLHYQILLCEYTYIRSNSPTSTQNFTNNYINQILTGGIKWKF